jgi:hypothetical protein
VPSRTARPDAVAELLAPFEAADPATTAVRELLVAASAPAATGELRGQVAALAAFRAAHRQPVATQRRRPVIVDNIARMLTVKAAAIAVAITATGGVAVAATTGALPVPGVSSGSGTSTVVTPSGAAASGGTKSHDWTGPCNAAVHGHALDNPGTAAQSTALSQLITAAGGINQLPAFCSAVLGTTAPTVAGSVATANTAPVPAPAPVTCTPFGVQRHGGRPEQPGR